MTFDELIAICEPEEVHGPEPEQLTALTQDSRHAGEGSVFIAVKGTRTDGHAFVDDAIGNGAVVVICQEPVRTEEPVCIIRVRDTRTLVGRLAQAFAGNPAEALQVIGITGTNGKTTVATLTYQLLQSLGERPSLLGTVAKRIDDEVLDSKLTTSDPIELARDMKRMVRAESTHLVMEVSSHALDQQRAAGVDFTVAAFTNLSHDHLDYHPSIEAYAATKKLLFDGLSPGATAVVNADDEYGSYMIEDCRAQAITFGFDGHGQVPCTLEQSDAAGITLTVDGVTVRSPMVGRFNAYNVAQTFLIGRALGYDNEALTDALRSATGAAGRLQRVQLPDIVDQPLVLVDYAHTPGALENVLQSLARLRQEHQRLHVVFGCGGDRDTTKRPRMAGVAEDYADRVTITSDNPRSEDPDAIIDDAMKGFINPENIIRITDRKEAIQDAIARADADTIILIAGKGHETYQEINGTRHPFDDREIARQALAARPSAPNTNAKPTGDR